MKNLLHQQLDEPLDKTREGTGLGIENALRAGAVTLRRAPRGQITAATVVSDVAGDEIEVFLSRAAEIAEEYGLDASIRRAAGSYAVRFTVRQPSGISVSDTKTAAPGEYASASAVDPHHGRARVCA